MLGLLLTGIATFAATNIDDIFILIAFFAQANGALRPRHIVIGQYLGFALLVGASLIGFFGSLIIPRPWIGLLGLAPLLIGVRQLWTLARAGDTTEHVELPAQLANLPLNKPFMNPYTYQVAAVTIANGGDNLGIYAPLFATSESWEIVILLGLFFALVGVWCWISYRLTQQPAVAAVLGRYGHLILPFVLIGLGILILIEGDTASLLGF